MSNVSDTIVAIATPPGRGGIGVIRVSGSLCKDIAGSVCGTVPEPGKFSYSRFESPEHELIDRGIVLYFKSPSSYTGEDVVEFQAHGGQVVLNCLLEQIIKLGARLARPGEFTERAFLNNKLDLLQAEAVADLIDASSSESAASALRSLNGEFSSGIDLLVQELTKLRVIVEGALDFPEDETEMLNDYGIATKLSSVKAKVDALLNATRQGQILKDGINIVILGPPNAGKSTLLNVLSQTDKAIVSAHPGTTRDLLEEKILIDGIPLNIIDTAGIRDTDNEVEQEGIKRAWQAADKADLVLLVKDASDTRHRQSDPLHKRLLSGRCIILYNKIDLLNKEATSTELTERSAELYVSIKSGLGLDLLKREIKRIMGLNESAEVVLPGRTRHLQALQETTGFLQKAEAALINNNVAAELMAEDLLQAQQALEKITGASTPDDLLGEIFSSYCIGK